MTFLAVKEKKNSVVFSLILFFLPQRCIKILCCLPCDNTHWVHGSSLTLLLHSAKLEAVSGGRDDIQISCPALFIMVRVSVPSTGNQVSNSSQLSPNQLPWEIRFLWRWCCLYGWHSGFYYFQFAPKKKKKKKSCDCNVLYKLLISNLQSALDGYISFCNWCFFYAFHYTFNKNRSLWQLFNKYPLMFFLGSVILP